MRMNIALSQLATVTLEEPKEALQHAISRLDNACVKRMCRARPAMCARLGFS